MASIATDTFLDVVERPRASTPANRPIHVPDRRTRKFVRRMVVAGIPQNAIAEMLDIDPNTLATNYPLEIKAINDAIQRVAAVLFRKALAGDTTAAIFYLKARAGWRDRDATQIAVQANVLAPSREQLDLEQDMIGKIEQLRPQVKVKALVHEPD